MKMEIWEHRHRFGSSIFTMLRQDLEPEFDQQAVIEKHHVEFEPELDEELEFVYDVIIPMELMKLQDKSDLANTLFAIRFLQSNLADPEVETLMIESEHFTEKGIQVYDTARLDDLCANLNL